MAEYIRKVLSENYAREICGWKYEGAYFVYNFFDWDTLVADDWDFAIKEKREAEFIAVLADEELIAFGRVSENNGKAMLGVGLKPSWCGKGFGITVMEILIEEARERLPGRVIALEVRSFNTRAIGCYQKAGFAVKDKYRKDTAIGEDEFVYMEFGKTDNS